MFQKMNFDRANVGLDLIANQKLVERAADELAALTHRLIERLLDQLDAFGRAATESEDTYLRRAIITYGEADRPAAVSWAWRAADVGNTYIASGLPEPDRTVPLREMLSRAQSGIQQAH